MILQEIKNIIRRSAEEKYGATTVSDFAVEAPENREHGDYATTIAMMLAKALRQNPMEIGEELKNTLKENPLFANVTLSAPGFINFVLCDSALLGRMNDVLKNPSHWGRSNEGEGKTVVVEYFQLNIAKTPHIGHLRSAVIGDSLKRMFLASGYRVISDTHVGDWGTQFGYLLYGYKKRLKEDADGLWQRAVGENPFNALGELYNETVKDEHNLSYAKEEFAKLEQGDQENRRIWKWMLDISMKKLEESITRLELLPFEEHRGESAYEKDVQAIAESALREKVAVKKEDSAVVVDLSSEGIDEAVLIKSDGASTYLTRDLATIKYRKETHKFLKNCYIVDVRQTHHFRQLFRVAEKLGLTSPEENVHVVFGFMSLPGGAVSTREGRVISLVDVLDEAEKRAAGIIAEKNSDLHNAKEIAREVALGAVKYFDLSHNRKSDIVFRWDDVLSFEGNSGPYVQYTHARLKSILRKAKFLSEEGEFSEKMDASEHRLLTTLLQFPGAVAEACREYAPHILAQYLYNLAREINEFYHSHPVMQEKDSSTQLLRIKLITFAALTLTQGLNLLGITAPDEM